MSHASELTFLHRAAAAAAAPGRMVARRGHLCRNCAGGHCGAGAGAQSLRISGAGRVVGAAGDCAGSGGGGGFRHCCAPLVRLTRTRAVPRAEAANPELNQRLTTFEDRAGKNGNDPFLELLAADTLRQTEDAAARNSGSR